MLDHKCQSISKFWQEKVGQFDEFFSVIIYGNESQSHTLLIRGRVIGSSFSLSLLDFGTLSYGFLYTQQLELKNTSDIPLDYSIVIHQDSTFNQSDFNLQDGTGTLPRHSSKIH